MMTLLILAILGVCLGSFINALVWRIHVGMDIVHGRSQCPNCSHQLAARDLIPVLSWVLLKGHCRHCQAKISWQYPVVEIATAAVFILSYIFWPQNIVGGGQWTLFVTWLASSVGLIALLVSDLKWMLLPNKIIYPTFFIAAAGRAVYMVGFQADKTHGLLQWLASLLVASGFFWLLFIVSSGRWIGYGDVRLGLITGTLLADPAKSLLMIILSSFLGTLFMAPLLAMRHRTWGAKIPYGPFLIVSAALTLLFGDSIISWYSHLIAR